MTKTALSFRANELEKNYEKLDSKIERYFSALDVRLDKIMENHLPHLQIELEALKTRVSVLFAVNIGSIILALLINKFL